MKFGIHLRVDAQRDFYRIQAYYDAEAPEHTERFLDEFFAVAELLGEFPHSGPPLRAGARRVNLSIFPYQLWYRSHDDVHEIEIIAVVHHRQGSPELDERLRQDED